jgi:signal transduction histidine kinase
MNRESESSSQALRGAMPRVRPARREIRGGFRLLRWYSLSSLVAMTGVAILFAVLGSRFMATETLQRDAVLTAQFIHSMVETESQHWGFAPKASLAEVLDPKVDPTPMGFSAAQVKAARAEFYDHIRLLPDELLANVYARDLTIVWSSNPALVGKTDKENASLREAFTSREMVARGHLERDHTKKEQSFLSEPKQMFIENYIPLRSVAGEVVAVVEVYKEPKDLLTIIERGERLVWAASAGAAVLVYLVTFGIVRRGHRLLMDQQQRLMENETLVAVGELSTAIAHSLRNPLAAIRSSAELAQDEDNPRTRKLAGDVIRQVDRMSRWIKDLLTYTRPQTVREEGVPLVPLVADVFGEFAPQCAQRGIELRNGLADGLPDVWGNRTMIAQVLQSVISNAIEAISGTGSIRVSARQDGNRLILLISDSGRGMTPAQLEMAFRPFATTKANGLGVGLALVRQIMERFGGMVELASQENVGTDVHLSFRVA